MRLIQLIAMNFKFDARGSLIGKSCEAEMTPKIGRMRLSDWQNDALAKIHCLALISWWIADTGMCR